MVKFVLEHRSSCYVRPKRKRSAWRLRAEDIDEKFEFPLWVEVKLLWQKIAPEEAELKYFVSDRRQLVFTVPVKAMTSSRKKCFLKGVYEIYTREKECV